MMKLNTKKREKARKGFVQIYGKQELVNKRNKSLCPMSNFMSNFPDV